MLRKLEGRTLTTRKGEMVKITSIEFKSALPVTVKVPVDVSVDEPGRVPVDEPGRVQESVSVTAKCASYTKKKTLF